ncbi:MAG TPA: NAD(P)/FAD-dependent oxidoreductase [Gaiellales bacterium]|nr:NAD(P)/FAD-dependent oxidoreductase [Gaiellales bacterium]
MPERVVILGGGFAGIGAARKLKDADAEVVLIDQHDYHTFQPLLYQVATDLLEPAAVGHPLRDLFHDQPNATVHEATVVEIDTEARRVTFAEMPPLAYDHLVLALGASVNFFGVEGAGDHSFPLYTLADAVRLKEHVLERWEAADRDPELVDDGVLNVVFVGGGPTGIESAGAFAELYRSEFTKDYPHLPQDRIRLILVEAGDDVFMMFKPDIREYTRQALEKRGVELMLGETVASVTPTRVNLASGTSIDAHTLVWGAGLQANPVGAALGVELARGGRIPVEPDLSVPGHPEISAVGDIAAITEHGAERPLPQLGSVALQSGEQAGANIAARIAGKDTKPFRYHDKGTMATIGRGAAVIQTHHGHTITGASASLAWGAVHLALLSTGEDRAKAMIDWTWAGFSHERPGRISVDTKDSQPAAR